MCCHMEWIGIYQWWCQMDAAGQAAWVQGIGTILAVAVAIWIPYSQKNRERTEKAANDRKIVMSAAAALDVALSYQNTIITFAPAGDGVIGHEMNLEQAREFMKLAPQTREALQNALNKSHYFSEELCEQIVRLSIEAAAYERIIDETARFTPNANVDEFFKKLQGTKDKLKKRLENVLRLLQDYLPKQH